MNITNSTIVNNTAVGSPDGSGGGIKLLGDTPAILGSNFLSEVVIKNTLLANNSGGFPNCDNINFSGPTIITNTITNLGGNLSDSDTEGDFCASSFDMDFTTATMLGPLQDNGGFADTIALLETMNPSNPAIDGVTACTDQDMPPNLLTTDQRSFSREFELPCDIGAFEAQPAGRVTITKNTVPSGGTGFDFNGSGMQVTGDSLADIVCEMSGDFFLDDGNVASCVLPIGTYTFQETVPQDFEVSITCTGPAIPDNFNAKADVNIQDGVDAACTFTNTALITHTVSTQGEGGGTITSDPPGINCGNKCSAGFPFGSTVSFTAVPDQFSLFIEWGGDCSGQEGPVATVETDGSKDCTASFGLLPSVNGFNGGAKFLIKNRLNSISISNLTPNKKAVLIWGYKKGNGMYASGNCAGTPLGVKPFIVLAKFRANGSGNVNNKKFYVPNVGVSKAFIQILDISSCNIGPLQRVILRND